jgi:hypothetical protein
VREMKEKVRVREIIIPLLQFDILSLWLKLRQEKKTTKIIL